MDWLQALILGIVQGLTEFLPVSSSGHLEIGQKLLNANPEESMTFTVVVHGATVMSTIIIFYKELYGLISGLFRLRWNKETIYIGKILLSMVPVLVVGLFFEEHIESFFTGSLVLVGSMLILTSLLLAFTHYAKEAHRELSFLDSIVIGIAQAMAVIPGISRSGATISAALLLGNKREDAAKFSFLMVILPIIGANILKMMKTDISSGTSGSFLPLIVGFIAAFITGLLACKWMISIVKKGRLIYFAIYCFIVGSIAIISIVV